MVPLEIYSRHSGWIQVRLFTYAKHFWKEKWILCCNEERSGRLLLLQVRGNDDNKKPRMKTMATDNNSHASKKRTMSNQSSFCGTTITTTWGSGGFDSSPLEGMLGILTRTFAFINDESMESERQRNAILKIFATKLML